MKIEDKHRKPIMIFLGVSALIIWANFALTLKNGVPRQDNVEISLKPHNPSKKKIGIIRKSYTGDYRDPFRENQAIFDNLKVQELDQENNKKLSFSVKGIIGKTILLEHNNETKLVREGDNYEEFILKEVRQDSVKFVFEKYSYWVKIPI